MDLSYPIGPYEPQPMSPEARAAHIAVIAAAPRLYREAVRGLDAAQLDTPYRPGGWSVRQTVHHVADSHMNAYIRFRLALTEERPVIKPYQQALWAELSDARTGPLEPSLAIIDGVHERWAALAASLPEAAFARAFIHPEQGAMSLGANLGMYAWHIRHHLAHILNLRERMGWK